MKTCAKCYEQKPFDGFRLFKGKYGSVCNTCDNLRAAKWYAENKERRLASCKAWFEANKERKHQTTKAWADANKEKRAADAAAWYSKNKDEILAQSRAKYHQNIEKERARSTAYWEKNKDSHRGRVKKYREARIERTPSWVDASDKLRMKCYYQVAQMRTRETGEIWTVDHIVPLQGEGVSGLHVQWNLQVITKAQNISKGNRLDSARGTT
jgi:5-methylcytosine-specific restriction endonuclease McrA